MSPVIELELVGIGFKILFGLCGFFYTLTPDFPGFTGEQCRFSEAVQLCKEVGTLTHQQRVRRQLHDFAGDLNRIGVALDSCDRTTRETSTVHHGGVELDLTKDIGDAAGAHAVVFEVVLDELDGRHRSVHSRAALSKDLNAGGDTNFRVLAPNHDSDRRRLCHVYLFSCFNQMQTHAPIGVHSSLTWMDTPATIDNCGPVRRRSSRYEE